MLDVFHYSDPCLELGVVRRGVKGSYWRVWGDQMPSVTLAPECLPLEYPRVEGVSTQHGAGGTWVRYPILKEWVDLPI